MILLPLCQSALHEAQPVAVLEASEATAVVEDVHFISGLSGIHCREASGIYLPACKAESKGRVEFRLLSQTTVKRFLRLEVL